MAGGGKGGVEEDHRSLFVVGDEDQRIYGWRGAVAEAVSRFADDFEGHVFTLEPNFRCLCVCARVCERACVRARARVHGDAFTLDSNLQVRVCMCVRSCVRIDVHLRRKGRSGRRK